MTGTRNGAVEPGGGEAGVGAGGAAWTIGVRLAAGEGCAIRKVWKGKWFVFLYLLRSCLYVGLIGPPQEKWVRGNPVLSEGFRVEHHLDEVSKTGWAFDEGSFYKRNRGRGCEAGKLVLGGLGGQEPLGQLGRQLGVTVAPVEKPRVLIRSEGALLPISPQFLQSPQGHGSAHLASQRRRRSLPERCRVSVAPCDVPMSSAVCGSTGRC